MYRVRRRGWRYFATRLNGNGTETLIDPDLPLSNVSIEDVLSGHNSLAGEIEPAYRRLRAPDGELLLQSYSTAIYAENDGDIRSGGILVEKVPSGPSLDIECVGFSGYLMDMPYTGSGYKGIEVDPIDVVRVIWNHAQSQRGGDIGLEIDTTDTGGAVTIGTKLKQVEYDSQSGPISYESGPYKLNAYTNHDLAADIDDLAADTPFDYHERHFWDGDTIRHRLEIGYKKLGRRREDLRFVLGVNIAESPEVPDSGSLYASGTLVLGAGEGAAMIRSLREPVGARGNRLRRIAVVTDDRIKSKKRADRRADQENQWRGRVDDIESIVVVDHPFAPLGAVKVGDEIRLEGRDDWTDFDMWVRVLAIGYSPDDGNRAEYTVARVDKLVS